MSSPSSQVTRINSYNHGIEPTGNNGHTFSSCRKRPGSPRRSSSGCSEARYDLFIAIPPHEAQLANQSGWIPVDPRTLQVQQPPDAREVYAVGDVTIVPLPGRYKPDIGLSLPKAGVSAEAYGPTVACSGIGRRLRGSRLVAPDTMSVIGIFEEVWNGNP